MSLRLNKKSWFALGRAIGLGSLLATLSLMVAATAQEAFLPVKINEIYWALIGLAVSAHRLSSRRTIRVIDMGNGEKSILTGASA